MSFIFLFMKKELPQKIPSWELQWMNPPHKTLLVHQRDNVTSWQDKTTRWQTWHFHLVTANWKELRGSLSFWLVPISTKKSKRVGSKIYWLSSGMGGKPGLGRLVVSQEHVSAEIWKNIWWVSWVEGSSPNQQDKYFFQISARTLFLALSHTFHCFQTHLVGYISKL